MPRVHTVQRARKPIPSAGVQKGDTYYWWKFRYGGKCVSKTYPRPSQLTQSEFLGTMYDLQERIEALVVEDYIDDPDALRSDLDDIASDIRQLGADCEDRRSNMPEQLQDSDTGNLLQERADSCSSWADELEGIEPQLPEREDVEAEVETQYLDELDALDESGKPIRALTVEERHELEERVTEKWREEVSAALEAALEEAKSADPGIG